MNLLLNLRCVTTSSYLFQLKRVGNVTTITHLLPSSLSSSSSPHQLQQRYSTSSSKINNSSRGYNNNVQRTVQFKRTTSNTDKSINNDKMKKVSKGKPEFVLPDDPSQDIVIDNETESRILTQLSSSLPRDEDDVTEEVTNNYWDDVYYGQNGETDEYYNNQYEGGDGRIERVQHQYNEFDLMHFKQSPLLHQHDQILHAYFNKQFIVNGEFQVNRVFMSLQLQESDYHHPVVMFKLFRWLEGFKCTDIQIINLLLLYFKKHQLGNRFFTIYKYARDVVGIKNFTIETYNMALEQYINIKNVYLARKVVVDIINRKEDGLRMDSDTMVQRLRLAVLNYQLKEKYVNQILQKYTNNNNSKEGNENTNNNNGINKDKLPHAFKELVYLNKLIKSLLNKEKKIVERTELLDAQILHCILLELKETERAQELYTQLKLENRLGPNVMHVMLIGFARLRNMDQMYSYWTEMEELGIVPLSKTIASLVSILSYHEGRGQVMSLLRYIRSKPNWAPIVDSLDVVCTTLRTTVGREDGLEAIKTFFDWMDSRGTQSIEAIRVAIALTTTNIKTRPLMIDFLYTRVTELSQKLFNQPPPIAIYEELIKGSVKSGILSEIIRWDKELQLQQVKKSPKFISSLLRGYIFHWKKSHTQLLKLFKEVEIGDRDSDKLAMKYIYYNNLINQNNNTNQQPPQEEIEKVKEELEKQIESLTENYKKRFYGQLIEYYLIVMEPELASNIFNKLKELESPPPQVIYYKLISYWRHMANIDQVTKWSQQLKSDHNLYRLDDFIGRIEYTNLQFLNTGKMKKKDNNNNNLNNDRDNRNNFKQDKPSQNYQRNLNNSNNPTNSLNNNNRSNNYYYRNK